MQKMAERSHFTFICLSCGCKCLNLLNLIPVLHSYIIFLFQTFLTLSLSDMANRVQLSSPREAEQYILNMVCLNELDS